MRKSLFLFFILYFANSFPFTVNAQDVDTTDAKKTRLYAYPYAFYTPETKFAFGGGVILNFFTSKKGLKPSQSLLGGYYSTNHNFYSSLNTHIYDKNNHFHPWIYIAKVVDKFYGIGNNTPDIEDASLYNAKKFGMEITAEKYIKEFIFGIVFNWSYWNITDKLDNPYLANNSVVGSDGGITSGLGISIGFDTRDYVFLPTKGFYHELKIVNYNDYFGSDFNFTKVILDLRGYKTFSNSLITGLQLYGESANGNTPFYYLPALGGAERMRGLYEGRYRDNIYVMGQFEAGMLFRIFKKLNRFGAIIFASIGEVSDKFNSLSLTGIKASYGFGFGYMLDEKNRTVLRADIGLGKDAFGVYFAAGLPF